MNRPMGARNTKVRSEQTGAKAYGTRKKTNHLYRRHANGLDAELAATVIKQVFQVRTQHVNDENVVKAFLTKMMDLGNAG